MKQKNLVKIAFNYLETYPNADFETFWKNRKEIIKDYLLKHDAQCPKCSAVARLNMDTGYHYCTGDNCFYKFYYGINY